MAKAIRLSSSAASATSTSVLPGGSPTKRGSRQLLRRHPRPPLRRTSEYTLDWFTLADIAEDAHQLMVALGFENYVLVGSSMGGMVAKQLVLTRPGAIAALALMNTGPDLMSHTRWGQAYTATAARVRRQATISNSNAFATGCAIRQKPDADAAAAAPSIWRRSRRSD